MTTNFQQTGNDLEQYLIPVSNKDIVPQDKRKPGTLWGSWGNLWVTGINDTGQLGLSNTTYRSSPVQVGTLSDWKYINQSYGRHCLAIKTDGTLWAWGGSDTGQLGLGDQGVGVYRSSPTQVGTDTKWKQVFGGLRHSLAIKTDGTLWTWGYNNMGQLGLNTSSTTVYGVYPAQVGSLTNWSSVSAGNYHCLVIKTDGTLWAWGSNAQGQLGLGNTTAAISSPVQIGSLTNWSKVYAFGDHSAAIKTDGTLWTWGYNFNGELGFGDRNNNSSPTQLGTLTNWKDLGRHRAHTSATKTDGTLWTWGNNFGGQLGLSDTTKRSSPVQVGALTNWNLAPSGGYCSVTIKSDGTLWAWGMNGGRLGLNDTTDRSSPVQVGSESAWQLVSSGQYATLLIK